MEIGAKIREARTEAGFTQEQAAEALGVSRQTVSHWENGRSYPDIVSVIRMSDLYSISLDHLLKERSSMKQTYMDFLEESTSTVKSRDRLGKIVLIAAVLLVWSTAELALWLIARGPWVNACGVVFRWILLPAAAVCLSFAAGRNDYWGRGKWLLVPIFSLLFLLVPHSAYLDSGTAASYRFVWPNLRYVPFGALLSLAGVCFGKTMRGRKRE